MIHIQDLVFMCCLLLSVQSQTGQILPPSHLSLTWDTKFRFNLSWAPPPHSMENCKYDVSAKSKKESSQIWDVVFEPYWVSYAVMGGGFLELFVQTVCDTGRSDEVSYKMSDPDVVRNLQCNIVSLKLTRCSWLKAANISNFRFFYRLFDQRTSSTNDKSPSLHECPSYRESGGFRTGCDLHANPNQLIIIYISGMLGSKPVRNIFEMLLKDHVRPPALNFTVTETKNNFIIEWIPPEVKRNWIFTLNYTECKTQKERNETNVTHLKLPRVSHCPYWMSIKAKDGKSETPWSEVKYIAARTDPNTMVYAAVIIPLLFAGLAVFAFVCCRKNKEIIFPKIPEPRNFLSDIYNNNNNKGTVHNLYIPEEEEENCKITLVADSDKKTNSSLQGSLQ